MFAPRLRIPDQGRPIDGGQWWTRVDYEKSIGCRSVERIGHRQGWGQWQNARGIRAYAASRGQRDVLPRPESGLYAGKWRCKENAFQGT